MLCAALSAGCFKVTYTNQAIPPNGIVHEGNGSFFLFAVVGDERVPAYQLCPGGVSQIQTGMDFSSLFLTVITLGLYSPRDWEVYCGGRP